MLHKRQLKVHAGLDADGNMADSSVLVGSEGDEEKGVWLKKD